MERHLPSLCPDIDWEGLDRDHLGALGPQLLGDTVWTRVEALPFDSWREFKGVVQDLFGLTSGEMRRSFRAMMKEAEESDEEYILRVEDARH